MGVTELLKRSNGSLGTLVVPALLRKIDNSIYSILDYVEEVEEITVRLKEGD